MKKAKKILLLVLCAALLVSASVMGTLAYLTSKTETITNTMSVGKVTITMDEMDVDLYGIKETDARVLENTYKLIPGHTYVKDPTIHVAQGSEACWLFVKIENGIADIEGSNTIADQMISNGWVQMSGGSIWYKNAVIDARNEATDVAIFGTFTIANNADANRIWGNSGLTISVTAYAIQADGFATAEAAWTAAGGNFQ